MEMLILPARTAAIALAALLLSRSSYVPDSFSRRTLVNDGDVIPGSSAKFNSYGQPSLDDRGLVVSRGRGGMGGKPERGIYERDLSTEGPLIPVARVGADVPQPTNTLLKGKLATFNEFPSIPRIDAGADTVATRGRSQPLATLRLPDATKLRAGTAGIYTDADGTLSVRFVLICIAAQVLVLGASWVVVLGTLRTLRRHGRNTQNVLVVGSGPRARHVSDVIQEHPEWGLRVIGFVDEGDFPFDPGLLQASSARRGSLRVHKIHEVADLFREKVIDEVVVACPRSMLAAIVPVVTICAAVGVPVTLLSDLFGDILPLPHPVQFGPHPALSFPVMHHSLAQAQIKRAIDLLGATVLFAISAPALTAAAIAIRMTSPGPILFRQQRCGLHGRRFTMLKLRTMSSDAEECRSELEQRNEMDGPVFKIHNDPRVTLVGRFLRRYSLDEIPQLWNVWRGDMSLVGPRPPIPNEVDQYHVLQRRRLSMRPGLTCLWQVEGRNQIGFEDWVRLDLEYIDNWSLTLDCQILLRTLPAVLRGTGAS